MSACRFIAVTMAVAAMLAISGDAGFAAKDPAGFEDVQNEIVRPNLSAVNATPAVSLGKGTLALPRGNPLWGISLDALHETRDRPLFTPSRRPPAAAVTPPPAEPVKAPPPPPLPAEPDTPQVSLLGVVSGNGEGYAVLIATATHDIVRLKTGEGYQGWVLRSVSSREAVLEKNNRTAVVALPPLTGDQK
jgi:general secretion pathway protein N